MSVMTAKALNAAIKSIGTSREKLQEAIHEALISCAYFSMKDGNVTPFNQLLESVGNAARIKGIAMWAELNAPVIIRQGEFVYNKTAGKALHVTCEDDFTEYEIEMRLMPKWHEVAGKEKVPSIFDCPKYLEGVYKKLEKEGQQDVAEVLKKAIALANFKVVEVEASV